MKDLARIAVAVLMVTATSAHAQTRIPFAAPLAVTAPTPTPFANNDGQIPKNYPKPLFQLSHTYPPTLAPMPPDPPWRKAIGNGPITVANAGAYAAALKQYVAADMRLMLTNSPS